jgi:3D (Asp-Asp-Asp) domain-containing protein
MFKHFSTPAKAQTITSAVDVQQKELIVTFFWPKVYDNATVTAYTASEDETDDTPFITADGTDTRKVRNIAACPSNIPFQTRVRVFGQWYVCHDRMAPRFRDKEYFDLLVSSKEEARKIGRKTGERVVVFVKK